MREVYLIYKKEMKYFMVRKAMVKWYIMICAMNILFTIVPGWDMIPFTRNKPLFSYTMMLFSVFLVPNTLSLDVIGGEKYHKTLETIIASPINIKKLLFGKSLFILTLACVSIIIITVIDNVLLGILYNSSFRDMGLETYELLFMYLITIIAILIIALLGSVFSLIIENLKLSGYLLTCVDVLILFLVFKDFKNMNYDLLWSDFLFLSFILLVVLGVINLTISKQNVVKCLK